MAEREPVRAGTLGARLQQVAADTPYEVLPNPQGFTLRLDLTDPRWWETYQAYEVRRAFSIEATVDEATGTVSTTTWLFGLGWQPGNGPGGLVPVVDARGALLEKEFGREGRATEFQDDPEAIHSFTALEAAGWLWRQVGTAGLKRKQSRGQKAEVVIAAVIAVIGVLGAIATGVAFLLT